MCHVARVTCRWNPIQGALWIRVSSVYVGVCVVCAVCVVGRLCVCVCRGPFVCVSGVSCASVLCGLLFASCVSVCACVGVCRRILLCVSRDTGGLRVEHLSGWLVDPVGVLALLQQGSEALVVHFAAAVAPASPVPPDPTTV